MRALLAPVALLAFVACATPAAPSPQVLLIGEQHDAATHAQLERDAVTSLASRGELGAVVLEMAPAGRTTAQLAATSSEEEVRSALAWNELGWPWERYREPVMAAVRAGVPVMGADLPRRQLGAAAADPSVDASVSAQVMQEQREAVRTGHCGLLPESQLTPMARVQVARDRAMARSIAQVSTPDKTVLVITGAMHADAKLGIPLHLPASLQVRTDELPAQPQARDYCEELRKHFGQSGGHKLP